MVSPTCAGFIALLLATTAEALAQSQALKFLISVEQTAIAAPFPARLTLHIHNSGQKTVWLYRRARAHAEEGSTLEVHLEPEDMPKSQGQVEPAAGRVFESVGLPRPRLVRLSPAEDYEEKTTVGLTPARIQSGAESKPWWGRYRLSATYRAKYSNAELMGRDLQVEVWQGEVASNSIEIEMKPPAPDARGSVAGSVVRADGRPVRDALVSLDDQQERLVAQTPGDSSGRFSFTALPPGLYWVTARLAHTSTDTTSFRHAELTPDEPSTAIELTILNPEIYQPKKIQHKPVIFRVTDAAGHPAEQVAIEATWSNGPILDSVKDQTGVDGAVALEVIPGRNFVTLKRRGCEKEEYRADVAEGDGIDGFKLELRCLKK